MVDDLIRKERLPDSFRQTVESYYRPLAADMVAWRQALGRSLVVGICGSQGSGKSTAALFLKAIIEETTAQKVAILSLDDLYWPLEERRRLAKTLHPLLQTRGVPGTHDVDLGITVITALTSAKDGERTPLPRFDKARDTQVADAERPHFEGRADVVIFEGWCVGAKPQSGEALMTSINELERAEDPDGFWRAYVNERLMEEYQKLYALLDRLIFLKAPSFECVYRWRAEQERKLKEKSTGDAHVMNDNELRRFIMHYERLTRHILATMPGYADVVFKLDEGQGMVGVQKK